MSEIEILEIEMKDLRNENKLLKKYIDKSVLFTATLLDWPEERIKRLWNNFYKDTKNDLSK